ncbi:MAG: hypothetical protein E7173_01800 [Firmicutes bacterium]|nr:hypothetical protein [Bacillota bacterium]
MKKIKPLVLLCAVVALLSGCSLKYEYNVTIKPDKSMDFSIIMAMDEELIDGMLSMQSQTGEQTKHTDEERWEMLEEAATEDTATEDTDPANFGFTTEKYRKDQYYGYKYNKKISNIDDISGTQANFKLEEFQNISDKTVFVKNGNVYKANLVLTSEEQSESTEGYDIGIDMLFVITLPNKPISHNATSVSEDGKTLTWNLLKESSKDIEFEFSLNESTNTMLYICIAAGAFIGFAIIGFVTSNNKKKSTTQTTVTPTQQVNQNPVVENVIDTTNPNNNENSNSQ